MNKLGVAWIKAAVVNLVLGVGVGIHMGASHDHSLTPVHAHLNLLGWASMAVIGFIHLHFGDRLSAGLSKAQFWLHQLGTPVLLVGLALLLKGNAAMEPVVGIASIVVGISVLLLAVNVFKSLR
jgi:hypothetical protein